MTNATLRDRCLVYYPNEGFRTERQAMSSTINPAAFELVPNLPQKKFLIEVVERLWQDLSIVAVWLGGSLARGQGDRNSDVDLRVALRLEDYVRTPSGATSLFQMAVIHQRLEFAEDSTLHHMLLRNGQIYDLFVQSTSRSPTNEHRLVLACRDAQFESSLSQGVDPKTMFKAAIPLAVRQIIEGYWLGLLKHKKVVERDLGIVAWEGEHRLRCSLLQLYHILATGNDCGDPLRMTIHSMSPAVRNIQAEIGPSALAMLGKPARTVEELVDSAMQIAREVARIGRLLSTSLHFDYPVEAERVVADSWDLNLDSAK
jgi:predicted nucleotidyltransferase